MVVDGRRATLEAKPMHLLHELLLQAGDVVTKDELLDKVWPGLSVVEASLPTAIRKLRQALGSGGDDQVVIETLPRVGYRLAVPVSVERLAPTPDRHTGQPFRVPAPIVAGRRAGAAWAAGALGLFVALMAVGGHVASSKASDANARTTPAPVTRAEAIQAIRRLDADELRVLMARGWDPNAPMDRDRNMAINLALEVCEWNPAHDPEELLLVARMLLDAGERLDVRNVHGDTPYSIAKASRFCGPNHPVTRMLYALCYSGPSNAPRDKCLATYEPARRRAALAPSP